jgi:hypothetical protein
MGAYTEHIDSEMKCAKQLEWVHWVPQFRDKWAEHLEEKRILSTALRKRVHLNSEMSVLST